MQVHYKKHFDQEQVAVSDKSTIGMYFTDPPLSGRELQSFAIDAPKGSTGPDASTSATDKLPAATRIVARPPRVKGHHDPRRHPNESAVGFVEDDVSDALAHDTDHATLGGVLNALAGADRRSLAA